MLKELLAKFCLLGDKSVIQIPKSKPGWIGGRAVLFAHILVLSVVSMIW